MNKILLINLKRHGDIVSMGTLIGQIKANNPSAIVSLLIYKEFEASAQILANVDNIITIDRKKVIALSQKENFSPSFALNEFFNTVTPLLTCSFDQVVNFSNDKISTMITSALKKDGASVVGINFTEKLSVEFSNQWSVYLNELSARTKKSPMSMTELFTHMMGLSKVEGGVNVKTQTGYDHDVAISFEQLRNAKSFKGVKLSIIGIQLAASSEKKGLSYQTLHTLLGQIMDRPDFFPVLLIAPTKNERELVNRLNAEFDDSLVAIETDFAALPSVIKQLDGLITPDTVTKHVANLCKTPLVEISLGSSPFYLQGSVNAGDVLLTSALSCYPCSARKACSNKTDLECVHNIESDDIMSALDLLINKKVITTINSKQSSIYLTLHDETGAYYSLVAGPKPTEHLEYLVTRMLLQHKLGNITSPAISREITLGFPEEVLKEMLQTVRFETTKISKALLATFKSLIDTRENATETSALIKSLDALLTTPGDGLVRSALLNPLQGNLENMGQERFEDNLLLLEIALLSLKDDLKQVLTLITRFESEIGVSNKKITTKTETTF